MCTLYFADGMAFTGDILNREDTVEHYNGGPTVNAKVTHVPAITFSVDFGKELTLYKKSVPWQAKSHS